MIGSCELYVFHLRIVKEKAEKTLRIITSQQFLSFSLVFAQSVRG